jgi:hypothetical protein
MGFLLTRRKKLVPYLIRYLKNYSKIIFRIRIIANLLFLRCVKICSLVHFLLGQVDTQSLFIKSLEFITTTFFSTFITNSILFLNVKFKVYRKSRDKCLLLCGTKVSKGLNVLKEGILFLIT